jgi:excisionase family DNA binding protein
VSAAVRAEDRLMTVADATAYLRVTEDWLYDNHRRLAIPTIRFGRQLRFRRADLDRWLDGQVAA